MRELEPDYRKLQAILAAEYGRDVMLDEAQAVGRHLINVYEVLLSEPDENDTITLDTTYR